MPVTPVTKPSPLPGHPLRSSMAHVFAVFFAVLLMSITLTVPIEASSQESEGSGGSTNASDSESQGAEESRAAVKEMNGLFAAYFEHTHLASDTANADGGRPPVFIFPEEDIDQGGFSGTLIVPVAEQIGARVFLAPEFGKRHIDNRPKTETAGFTVGGDLFWRDPTIGEFGMGPRYAFTSNETGNRNEAYHAFGAAANGSLFLPEIGPGPIDLNLDGLYLSTDVNQDELREVVLEQTWAVGGDATIYMSDWVSLSAGGSWSRLKVGGAQKIINRSADLGLQILVPAKAAVTLGANLSIGETETTQTGSATLGQEFFTLGVSMTVSFPGATSLVELNRHYY